MDFPLMGQHLPAMPKRSVQDASKLSVERRNLLRAAELAGVGLSVLSTDILKRNQAYLRQYVWLGTPHKLDEEDRRKIAQRLGIEETQLKIGAKPFVEMEVVDNAQPLLAETKSGRVDFVPGTNSFLDQPRDLPILGNVKAGLEGFFLDQGEVQGMARRPPILMGIKNAFAVYVRDDSMVPALKPGHILWVHPTRPAVAGENAIIEMIDGQAFVKEYRRRTEKQIICWQYNPPQEVKYDRSKIKSLMFVVGNCVEE